MLTTAFFICAGYLSAHPAPDAAYPLADATPPAVGKTITSSGMKFKVTSESELTFSGLDMDIEDLVIPSTVEYGGVIFTVTKLNRYLFDYDEHRSSVKRVTVPSTVSEIPTCAFSGLYHVQEIILSEGITVIKNQAFKSCRDLTKVILPKSLRTLEYYSFQDSGIKEIDIPEGVTEIEHSTFKGAYALEKVTLPTTLEKIGTEAFSGTAISEITFPAKIRDISMRAFNDCHRLENVTVLAETVPEIYENTFPSSAFIGTLKVPASMIDAYKKHPYWMQFINIKPAGPLTLDLAEGEIAITPTGWKQGDGAEYAFDGEYLIVSSTPDAGNLLTINGGTADAPVKVTIRDLMTDMNTQELTEKCLAGIEIASGYVELTLEGENRVQGGTDSPGIRVNDGVTLVITESSTGSLRALAGGLKGSGGGAGIGAGFAQSAGTLIINGGEILAVGTKGGAGFGSGWEWQAGGKSGGTLIMNGGIAEFRGSAQRIPTYGSSCSDGIGSVNNATVAQFNGGTYIGTIRGNTRVTASGTKLSGVTQSGMSPAESYEFVGIAGGDAIFRFVASDKGELVVWLPEGVTIKDIIGDKVIVTATALPDRYSGSVYGGGFYLPGETVKFSGTPSYNYKFKEWSFGTADNPASYTVGNEDVAITATFELDMRKLWRGGIISEDDGTAYVNSYFDESGTPADLEIPETIIIGDKEYTVISFGDPSMPDMVDIMLNEQKTFFTLPATIEKISPYAFSRLWGVGKIVCNAATPPALLEERDFYGIDNMTLYVPAKSLEDYRNHPLWGKFPRFMGFGELPEEFTVAMSEPEVTTVRGDSVVMSYILSEAAISGGFGEDVATVEVAAVDGNRARVEWSSDNTAVAEVGADGTVTAMSEGSAIVTAVIYSPLYEQPLTAAATVQVNPVSAVGEIAVDGDAIVKVYGINGIKVYEGTASGITTLGKGLYIIVDHATGTSQKISIK